MNVHEAGLWTRSVINALLQEYNPDISKLLLMEIKLLYYIQIFMVNIKLSVKSCWYKLRILEYLYYKLMVIIGWKH